MGFGKMTTPIRLMRPDYSADSEGFKAESGTQLAAVRAYHEERHGSVRWVNLAAFSSATDLFRLRVIPELEVTPDCFLVCGERKYKILSVEDVKGRGMYLEILAERCEGVNG